MSTLLAIDPGTTESAYVYYDVSARVVLGHAKVPNFEILAWLRGKTTGEIDSVVIEDIASYGRPVGAEVFLTCRWVGRFEEAWLNADLRHDVTNITRRAVKRHLCGTENKVNDAVIRQRIIDIYGGKERAIGNKKTPGPLYGIKADCWQALALALTAAGHGAND